MAISEHHEQQDKIIEWRPWPRHPIAAEFGITSATVSKIANRQTWKHI